MRPSPCSNASLRAALVAVALFAGIYGASLPLSAKNGATGKQVKPWHPARGMTALGQLARPLTQNAAKFEGGNIGRIHKISDSSYEIHLRSDNDDALPKFWRQWFYFKLEGLPVGKPVTLTFKGAGHWSYYVPVYSYDDDVWTRFKDAEVKKPSRLTQRITASFTKSTVWLARFNPYTYSELNSYLKKVETRPGVILGEIGKSAEGRIIPRVTITSQKPDAAGVRQGPVVMIHARTHPGEVGSSFLLEGLIDALTANTKEAARLRQGLVFEIVPMLNVDGVVHGNNRVTPGGLNLEGKWVTRRGRPSEIDLGKAPHEVTKLHAFARTLTKSPRGVSVALNLHSSAGEPDDGVFFFPHFGPRRLGYTAAEHGLFSKQLKFIGNWAKSQGSAWFNAAPRDGTRAFLKKAIPETWWWRNFGDKVMALSIESTYGRPASGRGWVSPSDMRRMGGTLAKALARYHGLK